MTIFSKESFIRLYCHLIKIIQMNRKVFNVQYVGVVSVASSRLNLAGSTVEDALRRWGYRCHGRLVQRAMLSLSL